MYNKLVPLNLRSIKIFYESYNLSQFHINPLYLGLSIKSVLVPNYLLDYREISVH